MNQRTRNLTFSVSVSEGGIPRRYRYGAYRKIDRTETEGVELTSGRLNVVNQG